MSSGDEEQRKMTPEEKELMDLERRVRVEERVGKQMRETVKRTKAELSMDSLRKRLSEMESENKKLRREQFEAFDTGLLAEKKESDEEMKKRLREMKKKVAAAKSHNEMAAQKKTPKVSLECVECVRCR
jgi:hypothetical protein